MRVNKDSISQRNWNHHSREAWCSFPLGIQQSKQDRWNLLKIKSQIEASNHYAVCYRPCAIKNYFISKYCAFKWAKQILEEEQWQNNVHLWDNYKIKRKKGQWTTSAQSIRALLIKTNLYQAGLLLLQTLVEDRSFAVTSTNLSLYSGMHYVCDMKCIALSVILSLEESEVKGEC